jgi:hypothetical protein
MEDFPLGFDDALNPDVADPTGIAGLTPDLRVEKRGLQHDRQASVVRTDTRDGAFEFDGVGVGLIEPPCH